MKLYEITDQYREAMAALESMDNVTDDIRADTMAAIEGELIDKIKACAAYRENKLAAIEARKAAIARMRAAQQRDQEDADWMESYIITAMQKIDKKEISADDHSFRVRLTAGRESVDVSGVDVNALSDDLVRIKREADKTAIKSAIESGRTVDGAVIVRKPTLKID